MGGHAPLSCAQFLAARGSQVEIVTPDKVLGLEMSDTNYGAHMAELYKAGVDDHARHAARRACRGSGNRLAAELENTYTDARVTREVDQVIGDYGTVPNASLYEELKPLSRNLGELDLDALGGRPPADDRLQSGRRVLSLSHRRCLGRPQHPRRHARRHAGLQGFLGQANGPKFLGRIELRLDSRESQWHSFRISSTSCFARWRNPGGLPMRKGSIVADGAPRRAAHASARGDPPGAGCLPMRS